MRTIEEIRADLEIVEAAYIQPSSTLGFAIEDLATDFNDLLAALAEKDADAKQLRAALSAAKELFEDECTPDERDSFVWLMQTEELLGR